MMSTWMHGAMALEIVDETDAEQGADDLGDAVGEDDQRDGHREIEYRGRMSEIIERDAKGRFLTGGKPGPGRPRSSRNRHSENFLSAFADDFEQHGAAVIEKVRIEQPAIYLKIASDLLPKDFVVTHDHNLSVDPGDFAQRFRTALELLGNPAPDRIPRSPRLIDARPRDN